MVTPADYRDLLIGVLAVQGDVAEHVDMLASLGSRVRLVKLPPDLDGLDGLIIPGGESTAIGKLLRRFDLLPALREASRRNFPIYGTCAGMILLANTILDPAIDQPSIGGINITVRRNAFGRQVNSFESKVPVTGLTGSPFHAVFIRAPAISDVGPDVEVLARLEDDTPVAARQENKLVTAFHPELTSDSRMHEYFLKMISVCSRNISGNRTAVAVKDQVSCKE